MADVSELARHGQEGSRWVNVRPSGEAVGKWFESVPLHEGMEHAPYVGGVTLIQAKEKSDEVVGVRNNGLPLIEEQQHLVYVPYMKVETRVRYFYDLMLKKDWFGVIEPAPVARREDEGYFNLNLPPGFFRQPVKLADGTKVAHYICCSMQVRVYEREGLETVRRHLPGGEVEEVVTGNCILAGPAGTKAVPILNRFGDDPNALMKAETGAVGRSLGMAGMLVLPGSGVATAEDMQEQQFQSVATGGAGVVAEPTVPAGNGATDEGALRQYAKDILNEMQRDFPGAFSVFRTWAIESRGFKSIDDLPLPALKGFVKKAERDLDNAKSGVSQAEPPAEPPAAADPAPADDLPQA